MKTLKKADFAKIPANATKTTKYDWTKLLDGGFYLMEEGKEGEGKDYTCSTITFRAMAESQGAKRGLHVDTRKTEDGCAINADRPLTAEEKAEWQAKWDKFAADGVKRREEKKAEKAAEKAAEEAALKESAEEDEEDSDDEPGAEDAAE